MPHPLLEVSHLEKDFGGIRAVADLSLTLEPGALLSLIGPNGCGKTTFFNLLTGVDRPDAGTIRLDGQSIAGLPPTCIARLGIGRKFQVPGVFNGLDVRENLAVALAAAGQDAWTGDRVAANERAGEQVALDPLLAELGLSEHADEPAAELPHGLKQRLEIAMVMAQKPRLVLLDEPTAGLTPGETAATAAMIRAANERTGAAFIVIEHDLAFVRALGAEVAVMLRGEIVRRGSYAEISADPRVREAYLGSAV